ncbi:hypothetical protein B0H16DRAFT_1478044 [Mycena metata]|uniref:Uncharacterized protein n=1 Tax=Mycena metata TaxID=1033252 RepID=A0AAD7H829_9AGAR|nr:hypothetical protein B0H16DRAFT_1478044 [Mycena metata]
MHEDIALVAVRLQSASRLWLIGKSAKADRERLIDSFCHEIVPILLPYHDDEMRKKKETQESLQKEPNLSVAERKRISAAKYYAKKADIRAKRRRSDKPRSKKTCKPSRNEAPATKDDVNTLTDAELKASESLTLMSQEGWESPELANDHIDNIEPDTEDDEHEVGTRTISEVADCQHETTEKPGRMETPKPSTRRMRFSTPPGTAALENESDGKKSTSQKLWVARVHSEKVLHLYQLLHAVSIVRLSIPGQCFAAALLLLFPLVGNPVAKVVGLITPWGKYRSSSSGVLAAWRTNTGPVSSGSRAASAARVAAASAAAMAASAAASTATTIGSFALRVISAALNDGKNDKKPWISTARRVASNVRAERRSTRATNPFTSMGAVGVGGRIVMVDW